MDTEIIQKVEKGLQAVTQKVDEKLEEYKSLAENSEKASTDLKKELKGLLEKHNDLQTEFQELAQKGFKLAKQEVNETLGQEFVKSAQFKDFKDGRTNKIRLETKNTILGESGSPQAPDGVLVQADRLPGIVGGAFRPLTILDFVNRIPTTSNATEYVRENVFTNNASETAEGASKPESDLTFELKTANVKTIAHFIRLSKQVMDDQPALEGYIDRRLRHGVQNILQTRFINGLAASSQMSGLLDTGNSTEYTALTGDNKIDFANRLKYAVIAADYMPSVYMINPADWSAIELIKKGAGNASYVGQEGAVSYLANGLVPILWGLPVVASNAVPEGTLICAASDAMALRPRSDVVVEMFEQDSDNVTKNLITVRGELRAAAEFYRPAAIQYGTLPA